MTDLMNFYSKDETLSSSEISFIIVAILIEVIILTYLTDKDIIDRKYDIKSNNHSNYYYILLIVGYSFTVILGSIWSLILAIFAIGFLMSNEKNDLNNSHFLK